MNHFEKIKGLTYVTLSGMQEAAKHATECVKTIRQWLPVKGSETLSSELTMDQWHDIACRQCFEFFKFHPRLGSYATVGPDNAAENWQELCEGMTDIRSHYKWESVDFESKLPHSDVRGGKKLKPIQPRLLDRVEQAGEELLRFQVKPDQWREYQASDAQDLLGVTRNTLSEHAKSQEHPYIEWVRHGRYRIDHSHAYIQGLKK